MAAGARTSGWHRAAGKGALELYYNGTKVGSITATNLGLPLTPALALVATTSITAGTSISAGTSMDATTTITAGTGLIVTTGNNVNTAGDHRVTAGNVRLGAVSAFATTEPTSAYVMKVGTNPVGAVTTSNGIFCTTGGATISKIIAAGTVSQIEA
jgi:hypothetical protein